MASTRPATTVTPRRGVPRAAIVGYPESPSAPTLTIDGHGDSISALVHHTHDLSLCQFDKTYDVITVARPWVFVVRDADQNRKRHVTAIVLPTPSHSAHDRRAAAAAAGLLALSGCAPGASGSGEGQYGFTEAEQVPDSEITVWVDASREARRHGIPEGLPRHPGEARDVRRRAGGSGSFQSKVTLMDQAGEGWPDVVFSTQQNDAIWASKQTANGEQGFAAPLNKGFLDEDFLDGFAPASLDFATIDDTVYGLRNDLAQTVFYYNQPLDEFGYEVRRGRSKANLMSSRPSTRCILGSMGDSFMTYVYYGGSESPVFQSPEAGSSTPTRATRTCRTSRRSSTACSPTARSCRTSFFSAEFAAKYADKLVGVPGPVLVHGCDLPGRPRHPGRSDRCRTAALMEGGDVAAGNVEAGGTHRATRRTSAVKTFLEFVTSADEFQVERRRAIRPTRRRPRSGSTSRPRRPTS